MPFFRMVFAASALAALAPAQAQQVADTCTVKDSAQTVVLMVCAPNAGAHKWQAAAQAACGKRLACNVWIWDDATQVPAKAPVNDADMPKDRTAKAVAIWVHDVKNLVTLKPVGAGR